MFEPLQNHDRSKILFGFRVLMMAVFAVFVLRLIQLQLVQGSEFRQRADENRFFTRYLPAKRGTIMDRNGVALVQNTPEYKRATAATANQPFPQLEPVPEGEALTLLAKDDKNLFLDEKREYPFGPALSHILGYAGEVTEQEMKDHPEYTLGENIGKAGVEKLFQRELGGAKGRQIYEMQANGKLLRKVLNEDPTDGADLRLTIDASLSAQAYTLLDGRRGAVVVSEVSSGNILVLVSSPSFDPTNVGAALVDENSPMLNRAISGTYPPGSTFKMMTALAGLRASAIQKDTEFEDTGELKVGDTSFRNWYFRQYGRTEGQVSLVEALQRSNDIYFYQVAALVGPDELSHTAGLFHYGTPTGIELVGEVAGLLPTPAWKQKVLGQPWYLGDTYHMGIGQGDVLVTPLQINQATSALANTGKWCEPHILQVKTPSCTDLEISPEHLASLYEGMEAACATGGTGFPFFDNKPVEVACKTGTAEFGAADDKGRRKTHAVFTVFAPAENPRYAVTVLIEGTEEHPFLEGSSDAAPIAKALLMTLFGQ